MAEAVLVPGPALHPFLQLVERPHGETGDRLETNGAHGESRHTTQGLDTDTHVDEHTHTQCTHCLCTDIQYMHARKHSSNHTQPPTHTHRHFLRTNTVLYTHTISSLFLDLGHFKHAGA